MFHRAVGLVEVLALEANKDGSPSTLKATFEGIEVSFSTQREVPLKCVVLNSSLEESPRSYMCLDCIKEFPSDSTKKMVETQTTRSLPGWGERVVAKKGTEAVMNKTNEEGDYVLAAAEKK